ncbi:hypothetical protein JYT36_00500 [Bacteroidales bacterium AH-315-N07]|nr:hypothetical protein [Bacteroidales bacterium AH-315-N07]
MKSKENKKSMVKTLREIRDRINLEIQDLSTEELKEYFKKKLTLHPKMYQQYRADNAK